MFTFLLWCILFVVCWPLALLALVLYPLVWILLLPFRLVGILGGGYASGSAAQCPVSGLSVAFAVQAVNDFDWQCAVFSSLRSQHPRLYILQVEIADKP